MSLPVLVIDHEPRELQELDVYKRQIQRMMKLIPAIVNVGHMQNMVDFVNIV